jgi:hypothetical protein
VLAAEPASAAEDGVGVGRRGGTAGVIAEGQAVGAAVAEGAPQAADGVEGDAELGGDPSEGLAAVMAFDDILPGGGGDGAGHGEPPDGRIRMPHQEILP